MVDPIIFIIITALGAGLGVKLISTQNPVYSGLYLVLLFFFGSGVAFLLGLEFIGLLFLLVYAGAIAVLVLFVVMMLDVKAIENPWSAKKKGLFYVLFFTFLFGLVVISLSEGLQNMMKSFATTYISTLVFFSLGSYEDYLKKNFHPSAVNQLAIDNLKRVQELAVLEKEVSELSDAMCALEKQALKAKKEELAAFKNQARKTLTESLDGVVESWYNLCNLGDLIEFFHLLFSKENLESSYGLNTMWFVEFDRSCALKDPSYLLYSTYAILLIIAGIILLIAMVGAISLTLQKTCPESLYRQLGRESKNAVFSIKEKSSSQRLQRLSDSEIPH